MAEALSPGISRFIVRLVTPGQGKGKGHGSGLLISSGEVLTARHVIAHCRPGEVEILGQAWSGVRTATAVAQGDDPALDLAIVCLSENGGASVPGLPLPKADVPIISVGDEVVLAGFSTVDRDLQARRHHISSFDGVANSFVVDAAAPQGLSGGPVFADGQLAGIMYARIFEQGETYFYGSDRVAAFVEQAAVGPIAWSETSPSPLRRFPLGPAVPQSEVFSRAGRLIRAFTELYPANQASMIVAQANAARRESGPDTGMAATVNASMLPAPFFDPYLFWQAAFSEAGLKSPRMLAALLLVPEDDALTDAQQQERGAFLEVLASWGGTR